LLPASAGCLSDVSDFDSWNLSGWSNGTSYIHGIVQYAKLRFTCLPLDRLAIAREKLMPAHRCSLSAWDRSAKPQCRASIFLAAFCIDVQSHYNSVASHGLAALPRNGFQRLPHFGTPRVFGFAVDGARASPEFLADSTAGEFSLLLALQE
jgi:hypothetical protein